MKRATLTLVILLAGCSRGFFSASGIVSSSGPGRFDSWSATPQGCTRDPADGQPPGQTRTILTLLWQDPGRRDPRLANHYEPPDAPMRLEFSRSASAAPVVARLETIHQPGIPLDASNCAVLNLETSEHQYASTGARPYLSGEMELDCSARGKHITGKVTFERCPY